MMPIKHLTIKCGSEEKKMMKNWGREGKMDDYVRSSDKKRSTIKRGLEEKFDD